MTTDTTAQPPQPAPDGNPPAGSGTPAPRGPGRRVVKVFAWLVVVLVLLAALGAGLLYGALVTERGTAYAWRAAVKLLGGQLSGTLDGGSLANGVRLRNVEWRGSDGTDVKIDSASGKWALTHSPWRFAIDYLHIGTVDVRIVPSPSSSEPTTLPQDLQLPMQIDVRDLRVERLLLHEGASTTEFARLMFHGRSDGRHHEAAVERLETPYGAVTAAAKLDGVKPFALSGDLGYAGKVNDEAVEVRGTVAGTLETLTAELDASGMKLTGHAHVEATPFAAVPLQRATLTFDHVNPQAFAPGAPLADLAVRAELEPAGRLGLADRVLMLVLV